MEVSSTLVSSSSVRIGIFFQYRKVALQNSAIHRQSLIVGQFRRARQRLGQCCYDEADIQTGNRYGGKNVTITAKYEDGVFKPLEEVTIDEGTIVEVRVPSYANRLKAKSRSVRDFAFYVMWKDRDDIGDSVEYVDNLRRALR